MRCALWRLQQQLSTHGPHIWISKARSQFRDGLRINRLSRIEENQDIPGCSSNRFIECYGFSSRFVQNHRDDPRSFQYLVRTVRRPIRGDNNLHSIHGITQLPKVLNFGRQIGLFISCCNHNGYRGNDLFLSKSTLVDAELKPQPQKISHIRISDEGEAKPEESYHQGHTGHNLLKTRGVRLP